MSDLERLKLMSRLVALALTIDAGSLYAQSTAAQQIADVTPYHLMADRAAEVALARSAAPKHVSDSATVLMLTRKGFVAAARGSNGFTCLVVRSFGAALSDPAFWSPQGRGTRIRAEIPLAAAAPAGTA